MDLSARGLRRIYRSGELTTEALCGVDLTIKSGEFVAIVGSSGSGKTTLLNCLSGLDTSFDGEVKLGDLSLSQMSETELARFRHEHVGFVFQQFCLLDHLTALENVILPGFFGEGAGDGVDPFKRGRELLTRVGLGDRLHSRPPQLSGGQKQRVAVARSLFCNPSIIFCDEPTGSLDQDTGLSIMKLFEQLNREDEVTVIFVTHEPYIADMARRRIIVQDGRLIEDKSQTSVWPDDTNDSDEKLKEVAS